MRTVVCPARDGELRLADDDSKEPQEYHCPTCGRPMVKGEEYAEVDHEHLVPDPKHPEDGFRLPGAYVKVEGGYKG
jgi:hypothetical protein